MAKAKKTTAKKSTTKAKSQQVKPMPSLFPSTDQYTPVVVALTWLFVLLAVAFVAVVAWRY